MLLRLRHHELCCLINAVVGAVPVDNHSIDSTADHVGNLTVNLHRVCRTVTDIHVIRWSEP